MGGKGQVRVQQPGNHSVVVAGTAYVIAHVLVRLSVRTVQRAGRLIQFLVYSLVTVVFSVDADRGVQYLYAVEVEYPFYAHPGRRGGIEVDGSGFPIPHYSVVQLLGGVCTGLVAHGNNPCIPVYPVEPVFCRYRTALRG